MKHLIILRCGKVSIHKSWIYQTKKIVDIAFVYYDESDFSSDSPIYSDFIPGTKLTGVYDFLTKNPQIIDKYDFFWLYEDDLTLPLSSLKGIVDFLNKYQPALSAPSLTFDSYYTHPSTFQNPPLLFRGTDFIECMAPIMRRDFLLRTLNEMKEFPVWGIERYWQYLLWEMKEVGIIFDKWPIQHTRPINSGSLYQTANKLSIDIVADDNRAKHLYSGKFNRYINVLFGVPDTFKRDFYTNSELRNYITSGLVELTKVHGEHLISQILNKTHFTDNLFTQFLSFPIVQRLLDLPPISPEESNIVTRTWSFGSSTKNQCYCNNMKLTLDGKIKNYTNPNEHSWKIVNDKLAILSTDNQISTLFDKREIINNKIQYSGKFRNQTSILYLKEN